jgi:hypothetical protein
MKVQLFISAAVMMAALAPSAMADTYMETTDVSQPLPMESREIRTTIEHTPVINQEVVRPTIVTPPPETIIVKKKTHAHHLLNLGLVKVF